MLQINYFASLREELGSTGESVVLPPEVKDVAGLIQHLTGTRDERWQTLQDSSRVLVAVNQTITDRACRLAGDEEVAFFPPMTGG